VRFNWAARIALCASPQVNELWAKWAEGFFTDSPLAEDSTKNDLLRQKEWDSRIEAAQDALVKQMRKELNALDTHRDTAP
jgi:hypothetical protein